MCLTQSGAKQTKALVLEQRKVYCTAMPGDGWFVPQTPEFPKGFVKVFLKAR